MTGDAHHGGRILSLDALRGGAILAIIGADGMARALKQMGGDGDGAFAAFARFLGIQFSHAPWDGLRFYDIIFPLFLFTVGLAVPLSLAKRREGAARGAALGRITRRALVLFVLGIAYYAWPPHEPWHEIKLAGVLQRIALCYFAAAVLFLWLSPRAIAVVTAILVAAYAVLLELVVPPGSRTGPYDQAMNLAMWVDMHWLPGRKHFGNWDPEGLLTTLPAVASTLIGVVAGSLLLRADLAPAARARWFAGAGLLLLLAGTALSWQVPIIKNMWTASYVLVAGGWCLIALALAYAIIDIAGRHRWALPAVWVGANAILIYLLDRFVNFDRIFLSLLSDTALTLDGLAGPGAARLVANLAGLCLAVAIAWALYVNRVFLRV
jgi:predicted acyltransferase